MRDERREDHRDLSYVGSELEDAIAQGIARAADTLRNVKSGWVKEQTVQVDDGRVNSYRVKLLVTFVLE